MLNSKPSLLELQNWLRWVITDPRGTDVALKDPQPSQLGARYQAPQIGLEKWIGGDGLNVYAEGYFSRILDVLTEDFASTYREVGADTFRVIVAEYLKTHPSSFTNIHEAGRYFPEFVAEHVDFEGAGWLADLVSFEWKIVESFFAKFDHASDQSTNLANLAGKDLEKVKFIFAGSLRLVFSSYEIEKIWKSDGARGADKDRATSENLKDNHGKKKAFLIFRNQTGAIEIETADLEEARLIAKLMRGFCLSEAVAAAAVTAEHSEKSFSSWFERWLKNGLVVGFEF